MTSEDRHGGASPSQASAAVPPRSGSARQRRHGPGPILPARAAASPPLDDIAAYYDIPANAQAMCDLLMRAHPDWTVWRQERLWHARFKTWPEHQLIRDPNAGMLSFAMRMGGALP